MARWAGGALEAHTGQRRGISGEVGCSRTATIGQQQVVRAGSWYNNSELVTRGQIIGSVFENVGDAEHFTSNDIKITGYEDDAECQDAGLDCDVKVTRIDQGGYTCEDEVSIGWVAEYYKGEWTAWWYNLVTNDDLVREEVKFPAGVGLWVETPNAKIGEETFHIEFPSPIAKHDAE